jgi:hypothetical protein
VEKVAPGSLYVLHSMLRFPAPFFAAAILLTAQSGDDKKHELSGAFRYEVALGRGKAAGRSSRFIAQASARELH